MTATTEILSFSLAFAIFAVSHAAGPVTYEMFGAKGDGKTDDRAAIIAAHKAANETGAPVRAKDGATYYVKSDEGSPNLYMFRNVKIASDQSLRQ